MMMNGKAMLVVAMCAAGMTAAAYDFEINIDHEAMWLKNVGVSPCRPIIGYAGDIASMGYFHDKVQTARLYRESGAYFVRMWDANNWWYRSTDEYRVKREQEIEEAKKAGKRKIPTMDVTNPKEIFEFWRSIGTRVSLTLEQWGWHKGNRSVVDFVKWIADNGYQDVVADFELGNETYYCPPAQQLVIAKNWTEIIPEIKKLMPDTPLAIPVAEYFENDPDVAQIRKRLLEDKDPIVRTNYFSVTQSSRNSAVFVTSLSNVLRHVSHVIYHCYGAETPYSCSYWGYKRYRNLAAGMPELRGKKWILSEVRGRSDEDERCERMFRESLWKAHYFLMSIVQPEVDGINYHNMQALSGSIYLAEQGEYRVQWRDGGLSYLNHSAVPGYRNHDLGSSAYVFKYFNEAILEHPFLVAHGTSKEMNTEDTFYTCSRFMDQVYDRRRAIKEGKKTGGFLGIGADYPKVDGEVEYVVAKVHNKYCLLMVNSKQVPQKIKVCVKGKLHFAPSYRAMSCDEKYLDCRDIPGDPKMWRLASWEDTQQGCGTVAMDKYVGMVPKADYLMIDIAPNTVQTVSFIVTDRPKPKK